MCTTPADGGARAALVLADDPRLGRIVDERVHWLPSVAPYQPGQFFERELPALRAVLTDPAGIALIIVDGYADLDPHGRPGLGAHLHADVNIPVIGVAKTAFPAPPTRSRCTAAQRPGRCTSPPPDYPPTRPPHSSRGWPGSTGYPMRYAAPIRSPGETRHPFSHLARPPADPHRHSRPNHPMPSPRSAAARTRRPSTRRRHRHQRRQPDRPRTARPMHGSAADRSWCRPRSCHCPCASVGPVWRNWMPDHAEGAGGRGGRIGRALRWSGRHRCTGVAAADPRRRRICVASGAPTPHRGSRAGRRGWSPDVRGPTGSCASQPAPPV